jgi:hypothetical protein
MQIDFVQIAAGLVIPVASAAVSAWLAAKFGVRNGLEQARRERAFDRRLEWYEKAVRDTIQFHTLNERTAIFVKRGDAEGVKKNN